MNAKDENITTAVDRLNALFAWWGVPAATGNGQIDGQMKRFRAFTYDLQRAYGEAYSHQLGALFSANERTARSLQEFLRCRQPQDVIAAESNVVATLLEEASQQTKTWIEVTQKVQDCCAAMAREAAADLRKPGEERTGATPSARPGRATVREADSQPARA